MSLDVSLMVTQPVADEHMCDILLLSMLGKKELVNLWWTSPNKAFGNNTPNFAYSQSPEEVHSYLNSQAHGEW